MLSQSSKTKIFKWLNAFFVTFITILLTILPIVFNIAYNLFCSEVWHSSITYAVAMSFLYSLIIPGFIGISNKTSYGKMHKAFQILSGIVIFSLYVLSIAKNASLFDNENEWYWTSFLYSAVLAIILLYWSAIQDEYDNNPNKIIQNSDERQQKDIIKHSQHNSGGNNE